MDNKVAASEIARFLNSPLIGEDIQLDGVSSVLRLKPGKISYLKRNSFPEPVASGALLIVRTNRTIPTESSNSFIKVHNPRAAFSKVIEKFFLPEKERVISTRARIGRNTIIGAGVSIGEYCVIGNGVVIGKETVLNHHVIIADNTVIGEKCYIKSGAVIGEDGFGFDFEMDGTPIRFPQTGRVIINNNVEIGANSTICRGAIEDTIIYDNVKIDDQVHVSHNCVIGENTIITAQVIICGSVKIGRDCWLAPNCSIIQKITIGDGVTIGIGAVVVKDISDNSTVMGLEARLLSDLSEYKKRTGYYKELQ